VERAALPVVVLRRQEGRGSAADCEVAAEECVELQVRRRRAEDAVDFLPRGGVVPGPDPGVAPDLAVELGRVVVLPEPAEDAAERTSTGRFGAAGESALEETTIDVLDMRGAEFAGAEVAVGTDDELGRLKEMRAARCGAELGE